MSQLLQLNNISFKVLNFNNDFIILRCAEPQRLMMIGEIILKNQFEFIDEVIATEFEICLKLNVNYSEEKLSQLTNLSFISKDKRNLYKLPIWFNTHEDWTQVMKHTHLEKDAIIDILQKGTYSIAMLGFLPGFIYIDGLPSVLHVPRKSTPSKYIPANSLAIGDKYLGTYSLASPGGWHVIGSIACPILDLTKLPPVAITGMDQIKIESITKERYEELQSEKIQLLEYNGII